MTTTSTAAGAVLDYRGPSLVPDEFDHEFEHERGRWLRRRFLSLCGVIAVLSFLSLLSSLIGGGWGSSWDNTLGIVESSVGIATWAGAFAYVRRARPARGPLLALVFWLTVVAGGLSLVLTRVQAELAKDEWGLGAGPGGISPAAFSAGLAPLLIFLQHFITCLFIPWTWREAVRPAAVLVAVAACIAVFDTASGRTSAWALLPIPLAALATAPGALVCWWRYSRFRRRFQLTFESGRYRKLQSELAGARRVHESCLPPPRIDDGPVRLSYAYEPMRHIGGDLLFVPPRLARRAGEAGDSTAFSAVVLDVTGHGIAAALGVNRIVGELERLFAERPDVAPAELLAALNRYVCLTLSRHDMFATAACVRVDAGRGVIQWSSGGHPTAFLRRAAGGAVERLEPTGMMLGVCDGTDYEPGQAEVAFGPGDALVVYTDGAAEAWGGANKPVGIAGVQKLLAEVSADGRPADQWPDAILRRVQAHRAAPPDDDTLVATVYRPIV
jgi:hypothetical protein